MSRSWSPPTSRILRRVLRADPGQEYCLYVPSGGAENAPVFVSVHGVSRNAREHARLFAPYCEQYHAVLVAPHFTREQNPHYQRLGRAGHGQRSDRALESIVSEVAFSTGASASQIHLFGFSGGAQFAHRYTLAHPHRVARAVFASAGWYTFPDTRRRFPYGIRPTPRLPGLRFDPEEFLCVPMTVLVGARDAAGKGLRRSDRLDAQQGVTRVERARNWVSAMGSAAEAYQLESLVRYQEVRNSDHSFRRFMNDCGLGDRVFRALFGSPPLARSRPSPAPAATAAETRTSGVGG